MIVKIVLLIIWIVATYCEGKRDGFFYNYRMNSTNIDKYNLHGLFTLERFLIFSLICWVNSLSYSLLNTGIFGLSLVFIFSFIHNGEYYVTRNNLDKNIYPKRWWDRSTTSESFLEFNVVSRTFLFIVGLIGLITSFTLK